MRTETRNASRNQSPLIAARQENADHAGMVAAPANSRPAFFQPALSLQAAGHPSGLNSDRLGEVVTGEGDINQCIHIILSTPKGSDPHRPTFGSDLYLYADYPLNAARPHIVRETVDALTRWEPRIRVMRVTLSTVDIAAQRLDVEWGYADGVSTHSYTASVPLGSGKAA